MSPMTKDRMKIDALKLSKLLLVLLIVLMIGLFGLIGIGAQMNPTRTLDANAAVIGALNLSSPVIVPSGHALRNPASYIDGVDLRFSPAIPIILQDSHPYRFNRNPSLRRER